MIHEELWRVLSSMDPKEVSRRSLASYDDENHAYYLKILTKDYLVFPEDRIIRFADSSSSHSLEFYLQLSAMNYLIGAKDIPLSGQWISEKQFPSGQIFFRGHHAMPSEKLEQVFGQDSKNFSAASSVWGGKKVEGGDIAFEFLVFPRIPVRLILWLADDEFPARVSYLFDRTANIHLQLVGPISTSNQFAKYESSIPPTIVNWFSDTRRPRILAGEISAIYIGESIDAAPTPNPPINRAKTNSINFLGRAEKMADVRKNIAATGITDCTIPSPCWVISTILRLPVVKYRLSMPASIRALPNSV